jgi:hypothetical protein
MRLIVWTLNMEQAVQAVKTFCLADCAKSIRHALLITHGVNDRLASPDDAHQLCTAPGSRNKAVKRFAPEETAQSIAMWTTARSASTTSPNAGGELVEDAHPGVWRAVW